MSSENSSGEDEKENTPKEVSRSSEERQQSQSQEGEEQEQGDKSDDDKSEKKDDEEKEVGDEEKDNQGDNRSEGSQPKPLQGSDTEGGEEAKKEAARSRDRDRRRRREDDHNRERERDRRRRRDDSRGRDRKERDRRERSRERRDRREDERDRPSDRRRRDHSSDRHQSHRDRRPSRPYILKVTTHSPSVSDDDIRQLLSDHSSSITSIKSEKTSDGSCHIVEIEGREARDRVLKSYGNGEGTIGEEKVSIRESRSRSERDRDRDRDERRDKDKERHNKDSEKDKERDKDKDRDHKRDRDSRARSRDRRDRRERDSRKENKRESRDKDKEREKERDRDRDRDRRDRDRDRDRDRERRSKQTHHRDRREKSREKAKDNNRRPREDLRREPMLSDDHPNAEIIGFDNTENKRYLFKAADIVLTTAAVSCMRESARERDDGRKTELRKPVCHHYKNEQTCRYGAECIYLHVKSDADRLEYGKTCPGEDINLSKQPHFETTLLVREIDRDTDARGIRRMNDNDFRNMWCEIAGFVSSQLVRDEGVYGGSYGLVVFKNAFCANEALCQTFGYGLNISFYGVEEMLRNAAAQQPIFQ